MKINLTFFLLFITVISLKSQNTFNKAYHTRNELAMPFVVELNNNLFFATESYDPNTFGISWLYKHSNTGTLIFRKQLNVPTEPAIGFATLDNKLLFAGGNWHCDVVFPTQTNYIAKYDANGNAVFQATYTAAAFDGPKACFQGPDSSFYSFTDSLMLRHSKTGQLIMRLNLGTDSIGSAILTPVGTILISAKTGSNYIWKVITLQGAGFSVLPATRLYSKLSTYNNFNVMALGKDNKMYKFSPSLIQINPALTSNTLLVNDFILSNDTVYSLRFSATTLPGYSVSDTSLVPFWNTSTTTNGIEQKSILQNANKQIIILSTVESNTSTAAYYNTRQLSASLSAINKFSSNTFSYDLALVSVVQDSAYTVPLSSTLAPPMSHVFLRARAKVKNVGTRVINSFKLNCYEYRHVACGAYFYQELFNQMSLMPGDSITVTTGTFIIHPQIMASTPTANVQYCFYITLPNEETDKTLADNELCKNFNFLLNNIQTVNPNDDRTIVFPNPFENSLSVKSDYEIKSLKLFNNLGELVYSHFHDKNTFNIQLPDIKKGVYFMEISLPDKTVYRKLIKE